MENSTEKKASVMEMFGHDVELAVMHKMAAITEKLAAQPGMPALPKPVAPKPAAPKPPAPPTQPTAPASGGWSPAMSAGANKPMAPGGMGMAPAPVAAAPKKVDTPEQAHARSVIMRQKATGASNWNEYTPQAYVSGKRG